IRLNQVTAEVLHEVYKHMIETATNLRKFECSRCAVWSSFLELIGIVYRFGNIYSSRDIQAFKRIER
ncbi:hypothetical protein PMAYCL1PPCAC_00536, partial [Pristionchus mayeri]